MVTYDAAFMLLGMIDDNTISHRVEIILLAEKETHFCGFLVDCVEIGFIG